MKFNHIGIPTTNRFDGEIDLPHLEVENLDQALAGREVIIPPNSPSDGVMVAFIKFAGAPVELMEIDRARRKDL